MELNFLATDDEAAMNAALDLAKHGQGRVEPNPMVGCVLVRESDRRVVGQGWHQYFGGPHAEVNAIRNAQDESLLAHGSGLIAYVTLEPCSHTGKTGPCADALVEFGVQKVVVASLDPNPLVAGKGVERLRAAGVEVELGCLADAAENLLAPYLKLMKQGRPWVIAKWAMTLDGKIATESGDSQWISNSTSRQLVHQIRGRVDGVMVGLGTAVADDPMLNARCADMSDVKRSPARIVCDSQARLKSDSQLVQTAKDHRTIVAVSDNADCDRCGVLESAGCEVLRLTGADHAARLRELLDWLGTQNMTNVLVEGGGQLLGTLHDIDAIDEVHVFVGPKLLGGSGALSPVAGIGKSLMAAASEFQLETALIDGDVYFHGRRI